MLPTFPPEVFLLIHQFSNIDERRVLEQALKWKKIVHKLVPSKMFIRPFELYLLSQDDDNVPGPFYLEGYDTWYAFFPNGIWRVIRVQNKRTVNVVDTGFFDGKLHTSPGIKETKAVRWEEVLLEESEEEMDV